MSAHQTLAVATRLFAIWLFLYAVGNVMEGYFAADKYGNPSALWPIFLGAGVVVLLCSLLWFFPLFVARKILPRGDHPTTAAPTFDSWFGVGCALIGIWVLIRAVPALISYVMADYLGQHFSSVAFAEDPEKNFIIVFYLIQVCLGAWMFFGGRGLRKILIWARKP